MNKIKLTCVILAGLLVCTLVFAFKNSATEEPAVQKFTSFTVVESIVPSGLGRSRIISAMEQRDYKEFTSTQTEEENTRNKADREDIRVKNFEETKLLNFYNMGGIRFQNIAANDAVINSKVNAMLKDGWQLVNIVSGVESVGGQDDANGIFITRFYFRKD
jgi:hypothetical protein